MKNSRARFDLARDVPDKASQLTRDGYADFVLRQLASHAQMSEALSEAQLGATGDVAHDFGLTHRPAAPPVAQCAAQRSAR